MRTALVIVVVLLTTAGVANAESSFVIQADTKIGTFAVKADGSLAGAVRAFGTPRLKRTGEACFASWSQYGLIMNFYNLGGQDPCKPKYGRFSKAVVHGNRWRTNKGLQIGMPSSSIRRYYPDAAFHKGLRFYWPSGWWLITRRQITGGPGFYPGLLAETARGEVISFQVRFPAGGD